MRYTRQTFGVYWGYTGGILEVSILLLHFMEYFVDVFFIVTKELLRRPPIKSAMLHCISKLFIINTPLELLKVRPLRFDSSNLNNLSIKSLYIAIWCLSSTPFLNKTRHGLWTPRESFFSKI